VTLPQAGSRSHRAESLIWAAKKVLPRAGWGVLVVGLGVLSGRITDFEGAPTWKLFVGYVLGSLIVILLLAALRPAKWTWLSSIRVGVTIAPLLSFALFLLWFPSWSLWQQIWIGAVTGLLLGTIYSTMFYLFWGRRIFKM